MTRGFFAGRARAVLASAALFVALAGIALRPLPTRLADGLPAGSDPPHHVYILDWLLDHALSSDRFEGRMFHPARNAVLRSDLSLGTVVLMAPVAPFADDPVVRYNLATWIALAFSGFAFHLLGWRLSGSFLGGVVAGVLAVMGSHQSLHVVHLNLLSAGWMPLFVLGVVALHDGVRIGSVLLTGAAFALSASSSGYYGVALCVVAAPLLAAALRRRNALGFLAAGLIAAALLAPYVSAYFDLRAAEGMVRTDREVLRGSLTWRDFGSRALAHRWNPLAGEALFPGIAMTVLAATGVGVAFRERSRLLIALSAGLAVLVWLALGPEGGLYPVVTLVPPFSSMRHPATLAAVALMFASVFAAVGLARIERTNPRLVWPLVAFTVAEALCPPTPIVNVAPGIPAIYERALAREPGPILDGAPFDHEPLVWAARRGFETLNGGGAFIPPLTHRIQTNVVNHWITDRFEPIDESKAARALLNETGLRYYIVPAGRIGSLAPLVQRFSESRCFRLVDQAEGDRLYEAVRDATCPAWNPVPAR